jgi:hypothetical protein
VYGFIPEEISWATMQEHELDAQRIAAHPIRRARPRSLRAKVARKLVQTGLRLDDRAGIAVLKASAKGGY